ncbi:MAG: hypothetical protein EXS37_05625 [Opitutus sp.]|nr:hypothetical protein [Opitutus sp.]
MGSSSHPSAAASAEFLAVFRAHADAAGTMTFERFMAIALYHPEVGYYRRNRPRVGRGAGTDFFTASSSGPLFGELVCAACVKLLQAAGRDPKIHRFVEIGAEPGSNGVLTGVTHPFADNLVLRVGETFRLAGDCVVFSNELFDAQPFQRTVFRAGRWWETGVRIEGTHLLEIEHELPHNADPSTATEGYRFDRPRAATTLAATIAAEPWRGLLVVFDYGKTLRALIEETPGGTARAYHNHTKTNDLLARPGDQDLTCHICWDWIGDAVRQRGFSEPKLEFQEAFFIRHAGELIAATSAAEAQRLSQRKLALLQLLHPAHMGQKFQVMHALR